MENPQGEINDHGTKSRNNSLSTGTFCTPKFYSKKTRALCQEENNNLKNLANKTKQTTKNSQHVASNGGGAVQDVGVLLMYSKAQMEKAKKLI